LEKCAKKRRLHPIFGAFSATTTAFNIHKTELKNLLRKIIVPNFAEAKIC
jgi:hypothetical protein